MSVNLSCIPKSDAEIIGQASVTEIYISFLHHRLKFAIIYPSILEIQEQILEQDAVVKKERKANALNDSK